MKLEQTREQNLSAIGKAYIDMKNGSAIGLMIVVRDFDGESAVAEVISYELTDAEAYILLSSMAQNIRGDLGDGH